MARYTGPQCKICRREGEKLFLKGARCLTPNCGIEKRNYPPGPQGSEAQYRRSRASDYSRQLREKQKVRRIYGVLERQFRRYFREALQRPGLTGENLLSILEQRLDNVVYRLGFAESRAQARQLVQHGHFNVNGRRTTVPSTIVQPGDSVQLREGSRSRAYFKELRETVGDRPVAEWLRRDAAALSGEMLRAPDRADIDYTISEQLVVEYYSR